MTIPLTLFDLFGETTIEGVVARWPQRVQNSIGYGADWPPPDLRLWLAALNNAVTVSDVRTAAGEDRVAVEAKLAMPGTAAYPDGFPFVLSSMPDIEFRIRPATAIENHIQLFASMSDRGIELVLERLPVEIRLPPGLIDPHPQPGGDIPDSTPSYELGDFRPGHLDDLKIRFDRDHPASIFVHIRIHMTEDGEFDMRPSVPITFGKCVFSGIPCLALHDFQLIPSPNIAPHNNHWLRHEIGPWAPSVTGPIDGCFSIRSVHIDPETPPISDFAHWLNSHQETEDNQAATTVAPPTPPPGSSDAHAEFVLDDVVVPLWSAWVIPIPRHVTIGVRRRILNIDDPNEVFRFDNAPVRAFFSAGPLTGFLVEDFFIKSSPDEVALTFHAAFVFGQTHAQAGRSTAMALEIGLEERYTPTAAYRRDFSSATGMPAPGNPETAVLDSLLHFEIATITIDIMTIKIAFSLGRFIGEDVGFGGSAQATVDLFVSMPPTGGTDSIIKLRTLNGEPVKFIIEEFGWRFGSLNLGGLALPDGVILVIADRFGLIIQELGLRAEDHATYLSFSGGLLLELPSSFKGSFIVKRLRFRVAGDSGAPPVKLDGFFLSLQTPGFHLEAGGHYTETRSPGTFVREFGLTGTVHFGIGGAEYTFGLDFLIGHSETPVETFDYLLAQVFFRGSIPIVLVELRGIRVLFARNMKPKLDPVDRESRELRFYNWYKRSDPLVVPGDRRLAAWEARNDSLAFGLGASVSFAGFGTVAELTTFVMYVTGPDEKTLLIVIDIRLFQNPNPVAYLAIELDFRRGTWRGVVGVQLRLSDFISDAPAWLNNIGRLTGTIFIGNDPNTFAIGRLADQRSWLTLHLEWDFWVRTFFEAGLCLELVSGGPNGFGLFVRVEGGINAGIVKVVYHAGFGFSFAVFSTGSNDYAAEIWIAAGLRIVLFGFLRFGISASIEFRNVGSRPSRGELRIEVRLETPWFLPDVTWTFEITFGTLAPADLATATSPIRAAAGNQGLLQTSAALHVERFDQAYANDRASRTFSVNELRAGGPSEATRIDNFVHNATIRPISIDSTIAVEFAVAVNDKLGLATGVAPDLGDQSSGDLDQIYDLIGIAVRRRARFGPDRSWHMLDERVELPPDFSDPAGVQLTGSFAEQTIRAWWDLSETIGGRPATNRLLLNSTTPFQFATSDPIRDEQLANDNPEWPCCPGRKKPTMRVHRLNFAGELLGTQIDTRLFTESTSRFSFTRPATARPQRAGSTLPPEIIVAEISLIAPGLLVRMEFDEDVAYCALNMAWSAAPGSLMFVAFDAAGNVVGSRTESMTPATDFRSIPVSGQGPIRRIEVRAAIAALSIGFGFSIVAPPPFNQRPLMLEIERAAYVTLDDYLDFSRANSCDDHADGFQDAYEGRGKLFFLPNHDYEVTLRTRVTIAHPSTTPESAEVPEYVYFKTKGLPGLNASGRVGEEVEQYVESVYGGGRSRLYRREPAVLCFKEDFFVAVPLALRPAGTTEEHTTLMRMKLLVRPDASITPNTIVTATSPDWIVAHRTTAVPVKSSTWDYRETTGATLATPMVSTNPHRERLASLTQRPEVDCPLADPRDVIGTALIALPQGEPDQDDPTKELWPAAINHTATVRMEAAPFVERPLFETADLTAMQFSIDIGLGGASGWHVVNGRATTDAGSLRRFAIFGDPTWNHLSINVSITLDGGAAGVGISLPSGFTPSSGLFALIETTSGGRRLVLYRRTIGSEMIELQTIALPAAEDPAAPISLQVIGFDDRIRATVGELSIEADRDEQREGRVALIASGAATFGNLGISGLEVYNFPFTTSRWRSFNEHILSWSGKLDRLTPNALGAATTTASVGALWTATQAEVNAAMQVSAEPEARDIIFGRWVKDLGLALKDEVTRLELSRFVDSGLTQCFLLESPEPIDFTTEVVATLERRVATGTSGGGGRPVFPDILVPDDLLISRAERVRELVDRLTGFREPPRPIDVLEEFAAVAPPRNIREGPGLIARQLAPMVAITDFVRTEKGIDVELSIESVLEGKLRDERVTFLENVGGGPPGPIFRVYSGRMTASGGVARIHAVASDEVSVLSAENSILGNLSAHLLPGQLIVVATVVSGLGGLQIRDGVTHSYEPVPLEIIQDGTGRRALMVPMTVAAVPASLAAGRYRLNFSIDRARWNTTAPIDDLNHYSDRATLTLQL